MKSRINPFHAFAGFQIPAWLFYRDEVSWGAKALYARLVWFAGTKGCAWPKLETLAEEMAGLSVKTLQLYLGELKSHELIEVARLGQGKSNVYYFLDHEWMVGEVDEIQAQSDSVEPDCTYGVQTRAHLRGANSTIRETNNEIISKINLSSEDWKTFCSKYPKRSGGTNKSTAEKKFQVLVKSGVSAEILIDGAERYSKWAVDTGKIGTEYVRQMTTWLNQKGWEEDWTPPKKRAEADYTPPHSLTAAQRKANLGFQE